ncbi:MAG TPA: hypothetical protein VML54_00635 [Candidatus Limnocylindrales bacterium]|nr:hypothetical protein [Candidatus Limnocylindrales bacterium]
MDDRKNRIMTGMFSDRESAERGYECLRTRGYGDPDVSLLMSDDTRTRCFPKTDVVKTELGTKAAEGAGIGALAGGGMGALLAGLAAAGIAVPGLPIIAAGPLAAALAGGGTGGALGALIGGLIGYGIPEERAKLYETGINEGGIVLGVTPRSDEDVDYIEREWTGARGQQIYRPGYAETGRRT